MEDEYYQEIIATPVPYDTHSVVMLWHQEAEHASTERLFPLTDKKSDSVYVDVKIGFNVPRIVLAVNLWPAHEIVDNEVGAVAASRRDGVQWWELASGQAWYYPGDHVILLWELIPGGRQLSDDQLFACWRSFEAELWKHFPDASRVITTNRDPAYHDETLMRILIDLGFGPPPSADWHGVYKLRPITVDKS